MLISILDLYLLSACTYVSASTSISNGPWPTPVTPLEGKTHICNIQDYGGKADNATDVGAAIQRTFDQCVKHTPNSRLVVPAGHYLARMAAFMSGGVGWAFQLDGLITRSSDFANRDHDAFNILFFKYCKDLEIFSSNGQGGIHGNGWVNRVSNTRATTRHMRVEQSQGVYIHDLKLVDAPMFSLAITTSSAVEISYIAIVAADQGRTDGISISGSQIHVHHVSVTNRDECVCVKNPAKDVLVEDIVCNQSGAMSLGSFQDETTVENVHFRRIQMYRSTAALLLKPCPSASGYVRNAVFQDFQFFDMSYVINIDSQWMWCPNAGENAATVNIANVTFSNFTGTTNSGRNRGSIHARTHHATPAVDVHFLDIAAWDPVQGSLIQRCENIYGVGECAIAESPDSGGGGGTTRSKVVTVTTPPVNFRNLETPSWALAKPFAVHEAIPFSAAPDARALFATIERQVLRTVPLPAVTNPAKKVGTTRHRHGATHRHSHSR